MKSTPKYIPMLQRPTPWAELQKTYENLQPEFDSMVVLIKFIRDTGLDKKLYAYTSLATLIITIYDQPEWSRESLYIFFDMQTKIFNFHYRAAPFIPFEAERYYTEIEVVKKFQQYIDWLKW